MVDYFEHSRRMSNIRDEEAAGNVADSMEVRLAIVARIKSGEITLAAGQAELKRIQRGAKAKGKITRNNAYTGRYRANAQAMSAGTAKTEGLGGDSPASAVRQDAPETEVPHG